MYEKLLLVNGGGVTGDAQKADQANSVNIIIGLGGTGKFCVRMIKTYAYQRLRLTTDDTNGEFKHIRFFAIDTDLKNEEQEKDKNLMSLEKDELVDIKNSGLLAKMPPAPWNDWWFGPKGSAAGIGDGAGGDRRLGRIYLSYAAGEILEKIRGFYNIATQGVNIGEGVSQQAANINFHIISGMGGGTGSGTFIDLCYLLNHAFPNAHRIGYFFLPEVNEDVVGAEDTKKYIRQNGFAAMQDLDYVMNLNGNAAFEQIYNGIGTPVKWSGAPVHMCHIISNQGAVGLGTGKARYNYAMNVAAEYIMDFLTKSANASHDLISEINNKDARVNVRKQSRASGYYCDYSSMGSSSAIVPYREINTYVISSLFSKFVQIFNESGTPAPSAKDCFGIMKDALAPNANTQDDINSAIYQKIASGVNVGVYNNYPDSLTEIDWDNIVTDDEDLRAMRNTGIMIPRELHQWYFKQYCDKKGIIATNASSLMSSDNAKSLIGAIREQLDIIVKNIYKGPSYALRTIDAAVEGSLKNIIEGLIVANTTMRDNCILNLSLRADEYNSAVAAIKKFSIVSKTKRAESAVSALVGFFAQLGSIEAYDKIITVLTKLKEQLTGDAKAYYSRLETVYNELKARFNDNLNAINSSNSTVIDISYADYLVTINQIKGALDTELEKAVPNIPNTFSLFMTWITAPEKVDLMLPDHEAEFIQNVNSFFIDDGHGIFNGLVRTTIDDYVRMAFAFDNSISDWHSVTNAQLQTYIYEKMSNLLTKAKPLIELNIGIQGDLGQPTGWVTIPSGSAAIQAAAQQAVRNSNLMVSQSSLSDRIFVEMRHDGVSMSAMTRVSGVEDVSDQFALRHIYSGFPAIEGTFKDWSKLPPLTPYQKWNHYNNRFGGENEGQYYGVVANANLFDTAIANKLIVPINPDYSAGIQYRTYDVPAMEKLGTDIAALKDSLKGMTGSDLEAKQEELTASITALESRLDDLFVDDEIYTEEFDLATPDVVNDPDGIKHRKAFYKDMFVRKPMYVMFVEKQVEYCGKYAELAAQVAECKKLVADSLGMAKMESRVLPIFEEALFTGMFKIVGNNIFCELIDPISGMELVPNALVDSAKRDEYPYYTIPAYQAFLTFKALAPEVVEQIGALAAEKANELFNPGSVIAPEVESFMGRITVWYKLADRFPDGNRILAFLKDEYAHFADFKAIRGL